MRGHVDTAILNQRVFHHLGEEVHSGELSVGKWEKLMAVYL